MEPPCGGRKKVYINGPGHMTKMGATPIYAKNLNKSSPTELIVLHIIMKVDMGHYLLNLYKVYINDNS